MKIIVLIFCIFFFQQAFAFQWAAVLGQFNSSTDTTVLPAIFNSTVSQVPNYTGGITVDWNITDSFALRTGALGSQRTYQFSANVSGATGTFGYSMITADVPVWLVYNFNSWLGIYAGAAAGFKLSSWATASTGSSWATTFTDASPLIAPQVGIELTLGQMFRLDLCYEATTTLTTTAGSNAFPIRGTSLGAVIGYLF